jgi:RTX calcium-binding nonapeptide repeat (4 copies)
LRCIEISPGVAKDDALFVRVIVDSLDRRKISHMKWTRGTIGAITTTAALFVGGTQAHAAVATSIDAAGLVTIRPSAGEPIVVSCAGGRVSTGATTTTIPCTSVRALLIIGTSAPDSFDTRAMTRAAFPNIAMPPQAGFGTLEITMQGKGGNDALRGGPLQEAMEGNDGNDVLKGGGGNDFLRGSAGDDLLKGGGGSDYVTGGEGDLLTGDAEPDVDDGSPDFLSGGKGRTVYHLTNSDRYATCMDNVSDVLIVTLTRQPLAGQSSVALADDGCGNAEFPPSLDLRVNYTGSFSLAVGTQFESFTETMPGGWRLNWRPGVMGDVKVTLGAGNDTMAVGQTTRHPTTIDGGAGTDRMIVNLAGPTYTDSGSVVTSPGVQPITYSNIERKAFFEPLVV